MLADPDARAGGRPASRSPLAALGTLLRGARAVAAHAHESRDRPTHAEIARTDPAGRGSSVPPRGSNHVVGGDLPVLAHTPVLLAGTAGAVHSSWWWALGTVGAVAA